MSDLMLIVPPGWTQLDWEFITNNVADFSKPNVEAWLSSGQLSYIEEGLKASAQIPADATVVAAKLIDDTYFLLQLG